MSMTLTSGGKRKVEGESREERRHIKKRHV